MSHTVRDWMSQPAVVIDPDSSVSFAMTLMRRRGIRSLVVDLQGEEGRYGIVTSTDIRDKIVAQNTNPAEVSVRALMTAPVITAQADWSLQECSIVMQQFHINHLPVIDEHKDLVGMISTTDLFFAAEETGWIDER